MPVKPAVTTPAARRTWTRAHRGRRLPVRQPQPAGTPCNHHHRTKHEAVQCARKISLQTRQVWRPEVRPVTRPTGLRLCWEAVCMSLRLRRS